MADLIVFQDYLNFTAQQSTDLDAPTTARVNATIPAACAAVRGFIDREIDLTTDSDQSPRNYQYDGSGTMDIDDCVSITSIATQASTFAQSRTLDATEWFAMSENTSLPIIDWVQFYTRFLATGTSPEMGFNRNLDTMPWVPYPTVVTITADWGWPVIPDDVKIAVVWTVETFINYKGQSPFNSESIASYSRSFNQFSPKSRALPIVQAIPDQAVALLQPYARLNV